MLQGIRRFYKDYELKFETVIGNYGRLHHHSFDYTYDNILTFVRSCDNKLVYWFGTWPDYYFELPLIPNKFVRLFLFLTYPITIIPVILFCFMVFSIMILIALPIAISLRIYYSFTRDTGYIHKLWNGSNSSKDC